MYVRSTLAIALIASSATSHAWFFSSLFGGSSTPERQSTLQIQTPQAKIDPEVIDATQPDPPSARHHAKLTPNEPAPVSMVDASGLMTALLGAMLAPLMAPPRRPAPTSDVLDMLMEEQEDPRAMFLPSRFGRRRRQPMGGHSGVMTIVLEGPAEPTHKKQHGDNTAEKDDMLDMLAVMQEAFSGHEHRHTQPQRMPLQHPTQMPTVRPNPRQDQGEWVMLSL